MRFCKQCEQVLNFFSDNRDELCTSCTRREKLETKAERIEKDSKNYNILDDTTLSLEGNRLTLRSKEGWELWSGNDATSPTSLKSILDRAKRIYEIRLRRQKN